MSVVDWIFGYAWSYADPYVVYACECLGVGLGWTACLYGLAVGMGSFYGQWWVLYALNAIYRWLAYFLMTGAIVASNLVTFLAERVM